MKTTLPRFYFVFLLLSLCLFSFEDKRINQGETRTKEPAVKEEKGNKKPFKHFYRYSNLC